MNKIRSIYRPRSYIYNQGWDHMFRFRRVETTPIHAESSHVLFAGLDGRAGDGTLSVTKHISH